MKSFWRALLAALVLLSGTGLLASCEDPLDRVQGEPGEDSNFFTGEVENLGASGETEASTEGHPAPEEHSEGEAAEEGAH